MNLPNQPQDESSGPDKSSKPRDDSSSPAVAATLDAAPSQTRWWWFWSLSVVLWTTALLVPIPERGPLKEVPETRKYVIAKVVHVVGYLVLTVLSGRLPVSSRFRWAVLFFIMAHAPVTELLQGLVGRGSTLEDVAYDHLGVLLGLILTWRTWSGD